MTSLPINQKGNNMRKKLMNLDLHILNLPQKKALRKPNISMNPYLREDKLLSVRKGKIFMEEDVVVIQGVS